MQDKLSFGNKPAAVDYYLISGSGHTTDEGLEFNGPTSYLGPQTDQFGDSTIPLWSSKVPPFTQSVPGDHIDVLKSYPFRQILYQILACKGLTPDFTLADLPGLTISLNNFVYAPYEEIFQICARRKFPDRCRSRAWSAGRAQIRALSGIAGRLSRPSGHVSSIKHPGAG
jgi:hypothetical protein